MKVVEKILLQLKSRDIASAVIAIPEWKSFIQSSHFIKMHIDRFRQIPSLNLVRCIMYIERKHYRCCKQSDFHDFLSSGHCILCLLQPHLLCEKTERCPCIDHRILWGDIDEVIWEGCIRFL